MKEKDWHQEVHQTCVVVAAVAAAAPNAAAHPSVDAVPQ